MGKAVLFPNFRGIPEHVQKLDQWLVWKEERRVTPEGVESWTKVPYIAGDGGRHALTSDKSTWRSFARTKAFYLGHSEELAGIGFCRADNQYFLDGDNFFRDRREGDPRYGHEYEKYNLACNEWDWAGKQPIDFYIALRQAGAWMEISPQHYGLHAVVTSTTIVAGWQKAVPGLEHSGLALYTGNRYLTVTGACLNAGDINLDSWQLLEEIGLWVPQNGRATPPAGTVNTAAGAAYFPSAADSLPDSEVIRLVRRDPKGGVLWNGGDPGGLGDSSPSGLDLALCCKIVFYGGRDPLRVDRIFRESALYREKWEREDYREKTIACALETVTQLYQPRAKGAERAKKATKAKAASAAPGGGAANANSPDGSEPPADFPSGSEAPGGGGAGAPDPFWWAQLKTGRGGVVACCHYNADLAIRNFPEWVAAGIVLDEFANVIRSREPMPWGFAVKSWTDADSVRAAIWMQGRDIPITPGIMSDVVHAWADQHRVHPLREWLSGLQWDGENRIDRWLSTYLGVEVSNYSAQAGAWWLGGAVARAFHPGAKVDYVLVLEGEQGLLKSTALRVLVGDEWFSDSVANFSGKDSAIDLQGKWVIELGEIDKLAENPSVIKAFLTRVTDHFRPPYEKHSRDFPRQTVFAGTVNLEEYLSDSSGNRRFWPVKCTELDLKGLAADREQIWAEAVERFRDNKAIRWPSTAKEIALFGGEAAKREDIDVLHDTIRRWVEAPSVRYERERGPMGESSLQPVGPMDSSAGCVTVSDVLLHGCEITIDKQTQALKKRVAQTMRRLGWKPRMAGPKAGRYRVWKHPDVADQPEPEETSGGEP